MKLSRRQVDGIKKAIDELFHKMKMRLLGRFFSGPFLYFEVTKPDPMDSLESIYRYAGSTLYGAGFPTDEDHLKTLTEVTGNYLDAHKLKVINQIIVGVRGAETKAEAAKVVKDTMDKATQYVGMLTASESRIVQAFAEKDGIARLAASVNDSDPTVAFLGRYDNKTCEYCLAMYHMPGNPQVPRVYKMSELVEGYFKSKEWDGKTVYFAPLHPNCRHVMTYVPKGYGFGDGSTIKFIDFEHDEYAHQRKVLKTEDCSIKVGTCECSNHPLELSEIIP